MSKQVECANKPELETILIPSVLCSKKVRLIATAKTELLNKHINCMDIRFLPDEHSVKISSFLMNDFIVIQGSVEGNIVINNEQHTKITLLFQEELICEGVCPGDVLKHTKPIFQGVIPPQSTSGIGGHTCTIIFKLILSTQVTVIREKLGKIAVNIIGDINQDRCKSPIQMDAVVNTEPCQQTCHDSDDCDCIQDERTDHLIK